MNPQQRLNRYYVSKNTPYLYKQKEGKEQHMLKGYGVQLYNNHEDKSMKEYNINYDFYIAKTMDVINELQRKNQLTLF